MSNFTTSRASNPGHHKRPTGRVYRSHACRTCREESGKISLPWLLAALILVAGGFLFSNQIMKSSKGSARQVVPDKQVNYIIAIDNSAKSAQYLDQARGQIERIMKEIPDGDFPVTLITLSSPSAALKGKATIAAFLPEMKPAAIGTDFKLLFAGIREQVVKEGRNRVFLISNGKYDPSGSIYLEGLEQQDAQAQSLVLAEEIRDKVRLPDNCELKSVAIGNKPDEIILQAIAGMNAK